VKKVTVIARNKSDAIRKCKEQFGWTPDTARRVDSGDTNTKAYMCFESSRDAELWDRQK
jgi:hypothetical protein